MSKGMWTKHLMEEGKAYYFNASQNRSVWNPPPDSVVHEASKLLRPSEQQTLEPTPITSPAVTSSINTENSTTISPSPISVLQQEMTLSVPTSPAQIVETTHNIISGNGNGEMNAQQLKNQAMILDIQAKIDQALLQQQRQKDTSTAKRFKKSQEDDGRQSSSYLQQKNEFENMAGSKGDEASKWLVR